MRQAPLSIFLFLSYTFFLLPVQAADAVWVLIDTTKSSLEVKRGSKTLVIMNDISIGRNGAGFKRKKGDDVTPLGTYKIGWINDKSSFHKFYGFNYPSTKNASEALLNGLLTDKSYNKIITAHKKKRIPPQNTEIGGRIGIHGLGTADKTIHEMLNWTHGCIALTDKQIDQLGRWINEGTVVKITATPQIRNSD